MSWTLADPFSGDKKDIDESKTEQFKVSGNDSNSAHSKFSEKLKDVKDKSKGDFVGIDKWIDNEGGNFKIKANVYFK